MANKPGRNDPCPCGSGKKYKKCCIDAAARAQKIQETDKRAVQMFEKVRAEQLLRQEQQGYGRPISAFQSGGHQFVAVRDRVFHSASWKTVPDFLNSYIKIALTPQWGNSELAKPMAERHQILKWYYAYTKYQNETIKVAGVVHSAEINGVVACYLGLAYSLYLLDHNVELQARLLHRLKDPLNFQGAYYELIVANILLRAGFQLTLEDETNGDCRHCEFSAISKHTGKKYWIEAKMRAVSGLLGKTDKDGTKSKDPLSSFRAHLKDALDKPAADTRIIFIDLNSGQQMAHDGLPKWCREARTSLEQYEARHLKPSVEAYVFTTNMPFHRSLSGPVNIHALPFGLGMPDFNRPAKLRLFDVYKRREKHQDAHKIEEAMLRYLQFPTTFDGSFPSEAFGKAPPRLQIGETYVFPATEGLIVGTVTNATVDTQNKQAILAVSCPDGLHRYVRQQMTDEQFADYKLFPDVYFGQLRRVPKVVNTNVELFSSLMNQNEALSREAALQFFAKHPQVDEFKGMSTKDLRALYCEEMVARAVAGGFMLVGKPQENSGAQSGQRCGWPI